MRMKILIMMIVSVLLVGCGATSTVKEKEIIYVTAPEALTRECRATKPINPNIGEVLIAQSRALDQCNDQLEAIRDFNSTHKEESNDTDISTDG